VNQDYDTIVVGGGAMGTSAARWLAKRNRNTLLFERFEIGHARGNVAERFAPHRPEGGTDTCLYTNTPDEQFVLDRRGPVVIGSPCSGYGFTFTPLIGRVLADLATAQPTPLPIERFLTSRFAS
jgi:glycine/D-amino acid oxidase-like deaminating enzyme